MEFNKLLRAVFPEFQERFPGIIARQFRANGKFPTYPALQLCVQRNHRSFYGETWLLNPLVYQQVSYSEGRVLIQHDTRNVFDESFAKFGGTNEIPFPHFDVGSLCGVLNDFRVFSNLDITCNKCCGGKHCNTVCNRCSGRGYQIFPDQCRNAYYDAGIQRSLKDHKPPKDWHPDYRIAYLAL